MIHIRKKFKAFRRNSEQYIGLGGLMKIYSLVIICSLFSTMIAFQNCGSNKYSFTPEVYDKSSASVEVRDNSLAETQGNSSDDDRSNSSVDRQDNSSVSNEQILDANLLPLTTKEPKESCDSKSGGKSEQARGDKETDDDSSMDGAKDYICVLEGNGKSSRLGIDGRDLQEVNNTPKTVCMSEASCLQIVKTKLRVKSAEKRGYCKGNSPHIVNLEMQQVIGLIDKL